MPDPLAYTIAQATKAAAIGRTGLYEAIASGDLPAHKRGRRTLALAADLRGWLAKLPTLELKRRPNLSDGLSQGCAEKAEPNDRLRVDGPLGAEREGNDLEAAKTERDTKARRGGPGERQSKGHPTPMRGA